MGQSFLVNIVLTMLFIIFLIAIYTIFFSGFTKTFCSSNQRYIMADLVNRSTSASNPTFKSVRQLKILTDCTEEIQLYRDHYIIKYKDKTIPDFDSNSLDIKVFVNFDTKEINDCRNNAATDYCKLPDSSGKDTYAVIVSPLNLKFFSS